jgi:hypothetical protein
MPLPAQDDMIGDIGDLSANIVSLIGTMRRANPRDVPTLRTKLRVLLQQYVEMVMETAPGAP